MIGISKKDFEVKDLNTYSGVMVRLFTFFKNRGLYGDIKYHHAFGYFNDYIIEAVAKGVVKEPISRLEWYDDVVILDFNFDINREGFRKSMEEMIGTPYAFSQVFFFQAIYQTTGVWLYNGKPKNLHCTSSICKAIYDNCLDPKIKGMFKNWEKMDAQDLLRMWKLNEIFVEKLLIN